MLCFDLWLNYQEIFVKFADYFNVSTDYLLGKTDIRFRKNVELGELGLSNKALAVLLSGTVNMQLLSQIIENKYFFTDGLRGSIFLREQ